MEGWEDLRAVRQGLNGSRLSAVTRSPNRAHKGTFHNLSAKHLQRYVNEFVGRHNQRESDTLDQMQAMVRGMDQKRLKYADLVA